MIDQAVTDQEYWQGVFVRGPATALPRWCADPQAGNRIHEEPVPPSLETGLHQLSDKLAVPLRTLLLGAHVKVLSILSSEDEIKVGYQAHQGELPVPIVVTAQAGSWRELLLQTRRSEIELIAHQGFAVHEFAHELGLSGPAFEAVFDMVSQGEPAEQTILQLSVSRRSQPLTLRFTYRRDAIDTWYAKRIAEYHVRALTLMVEDPDQLHQHQSLLSREETSIQRDSLAGRVRDLPDRRVHELFEEQVRLHPETVAALHKSQQWSYRHLNQRANHLGRALLARGIGREDVVAVVTERNLDWMAAVLAIFKAGGVYLPIEPHFPPDRIAKALSRADCAIVLTEAGSTTTLDKALDAIGGIPMLFLEEAYQEQHPKGDLDLEVAPDQLAYIYFTSGSTGEPKGAMCEHAGMLNHMYAKIDDLEIADGQVVAQTAPQCFDISLWQLVCALLVGGRTLVIEQDVILDVERLVDKIADEGVAVLQVVPSYLEAVLTHLEQRPRQLPQLRCVSVTGEALKRELAQRWFALEPDVKLVNAYGLTETSDDTNHEVMVRAPNGGGVPLGRPINNVHVYVVDERLEFVPLGTTGEIVFSGVCVGRGYVNDPERTGRAFLPDPHRRNARLYRSGDFGRWRPDGKLEFLGRRDTQVKVSGFRIEIDEIENRLLQLPGVRAGAVVAAEHDRNSLHLVCFYSASHPLDVEELRAKLLESLPAYMVPATFHWLDRLPLTANSKVDRKALLALAGELAQATLEVDAPVTANERRLATAWARVLGVPEDNIGRHDHFFDRGGTSLSAVKLAIALDRAVSLNDVVRHPVLVDQAALLVPRE